MILVKWFIVYWGALPWRDHGVQLPGNDRVLRCFPPLIALVLAILLLIHLDHTGPFILWVISLVIVTPSDLGS